MVSFKKIEDFDVFKRAYDLSLKIHKFSLSLPKFEQSDLANQLRRSSKSVCSNFAEGFAKQNFSVKEFRKYLIIALGSSDESMLWLRYCKDLGYLSESESDEWTEEYLQVSKMLARLAKLQDSKFLRQTVNRQY
ncbi:four helix bundle protein [Leptospira noguchii str. 1993005606]|uniref:Four helix bundle protein n=3 Tax=Leptospira noguchii TaxID=28182 RepID=Q48794_9LEPT|nr:unknown [Leptospira noguchii]EKR75287.1 four helix bundle protein [Leptospira noguchii str. 2006001870]EMN02640.1 four helix bundle protein [Leptospira noguchii str. 2007001578]EMO90748.1 four helix bundle protein [Leptospira noguchii str. 2001034031]EMS82057.1 four helix bundle protein [Leptospira noguchii str. Hook]EPE85089.1 four helix bundle protein [Leptospira noguchii str. 1993005606]